MKHQLRQLSICFLCGLFFCIVAYSHSALDPALSLRYLLLGFSLFMVMTLLRAHRFSFFFRLDAWSLWYLFYVTWSAVSVCWSRVPSEALFSSGRDLLGFLTFLVATRLFSRDRLFFGQGLQWLSLLLGLMSILFALVQWLEAPSFSYESVYRITGFNAHKNLLSSFLCLNAFFLFSAAAASQGIKRIAFVVILVSTFCLLLFLRSKAGIIFSVMLVPFLALRTEQLSHRNNNGLKISLMLAAAATLFILLVLPLALDLSLRHADELRRYGLFEQVEERLQLWTKTLSLSKKNLITGVGAGNWQVFFPGETFRGMWRAEDLNVTFQRPHNDLLWVLSETGLPGIFSYLMVFLLPVASWWRSNLQPQAAWILAYLGFAFCDFPKERIEHTVLINLILASGYAAQIRSLKMPVAAVRSRHVLPAAGILLSLALSLTGFLRYRGEIYTRRMYQARAQGQPGEIIRSGNAALSPVYQLDPFSFPLQWYMGSAVAAEKKLPQALAYFKIAYRLAPFNRNVLNDYGSALQLSGRKREAIALYFEANRVSPRFDDPLLNLAAIYLNDHNYVLAQRSLDSLKHDSERRANYQKLLNVLREESVPGRIGNKK